MGRSKRCLRVFVRRMRTPNGPLPKRNKPHSAPASANTLWFATTRRPIVTRPALGPPMSPHHWRKHIPKGSRGNGCLSADELRQAVEALEVIAQAGWLWELEERIPAGWRLGCNPVALPVARNIAESTVARGSRVSQNALASVAQETGKSAVSGTARGPIRPPNHFRPPPGVSTGPSLANSALTRHEEIVACEPQVNSALPAQKRPVSRLRGKWRNVKRQTVSCKGVSEQVPAISFRQQRSRPFLPNEPPMTAWR